MKKWCLEVVILYTGKQGLKYSTVALTDLSRNGSSENSVFRVNALTFSIITQKFLSYAIYSSTAMFLSRSGIEPYQISLKWVKHS